MDSQPARYVLRDDSDLVDPDLDLSDFYSENDLEPEVVNAIGALGLGERTAVSGGATGLYYVVRVA